VARQFEARKREEERRKAEVARLMNSPRGAVPPNPCSLQIFVLLQFLTAAPHPGLYFLGGCLLFAGAPCARPRQHAVIARFCPDTKAPRSGRGARGRGEPGTDGTSRSAAIPPSP
jgi:hypothetical protein